MRGSFTAGSAALLLLVAAGWGTANGVIRDTTATVRGSMELVTVNFVPDIDPAKLVAHIADQLPGVSEADVTISGAAGSDLVAHSSLSLGVEVAVPTGASPAVKQALRDYMSRGGGRYTPPFLATLSGENSLPYPFVLRNIESETVLASQCATALCPTVVTECAADSATPNLFRTDDECCFECISDVALAFHQSVAATILGHAEEVVTVSIDMELIPINDVPQANPALLAGHIADQLLGIQEDEISIAMIDFQNLKSHGRYKFAADITAPAGSSAAVIARMEAYMSERPKDTVGIDDVDANMYSKPFLASIGTPVGFPFPFVLKYEGASVSWDASDDCATCTLTTCPVNTTEVIPDLACCPVCETPAETAARAGAAEFVLASEGGRRWAYPMVEARFQLVPINDVANVDASKLTTIIASNIGIAEDAVAIVSDPRSDVEAHTRIRFTAFVEGPQDSLDAIVAALEETTSQKVGNVSTGIDHVSLPFVADLGAPDNFDAPYIIVREAIVARPATYCSLTVCPGDELCADGFTRYRAEDECCSSCRADSQVTYKNELAEYSLKHSQWAQEADSYSAELSQWRSEAAKWLKEYSACSPSNAP